MVEEFANRLGQLCASSGAIDRLGGRDAGKGEGASRQGAVTAVRLRNPAVCIVATIFAAWKGPWTAKPPELTSGLYPGWHARTRSADGGRFIGGVGVRWPMVGWPAHPTTYRECRGIISSSGATTAPVAVPSLKNAGGELIRQFDEWVVAIATRPLPELPDFVHSRTAGVPQ